MYRQVSRRIMSKTAFTAKNIQGDQPMKTTFSEEDLRNARRAIRELALREDISEERIRSSIMKAARAGLTDPDPSVQLRWKDILSTAGTLTPEKLIAWAVKQIR